MAGWSLPGPPAASCKYPTIAPVASLIPALRAPWTALAGPEGRIAPPPPLEAACAPRYAASVAAPGLLLAPNAPVLRFLGMP